MKYIAHGSLPEGISEITTPNRILADVENANKNGTTALLAVAKTTAKTLGYTIKVGRSKSRLVHLRDMCAVLFCLVGMLNKHCYRFSFFSPPSTIVYVVICVLFHPGLADYAGKVVSKIIPYYYFNLPSLHFFSAPDVASLWHSTRAV